MIRFTSLLRAEVVKLKRSPALRVVWLLPVVFVALDYIWFGRAVQGHPKVSTGDLSLLAVMPIKAVGTLWAGFFHPLLLALVPALVFKPEHRFCTWKHLHALPPGSGRIYAAKLVVVLSLVVVSLGLVLVGLQAEWSLISAGSSSLAFPFPWWELVKVAGWLLLGSLPLLSLYAWLSDRISSGLVPILFGLIGLLLNASLSGQELDPSWRRDLIPWILPYSCAQQAIDRMEARQETHVAGTPFDRNLDLRHLAGTETYYLPSGRKVTTTTTIPDYFLVPPPPTPRRVLAIFSLSVAIGLALLGVLDSRRSR